MIKDFSKIGLKFSVIILGYGLFLYMVNQENQMEMELLGNNNSNINEKCYLFLKNYLLKNPLKIFK